jgi:BirA family transcriptional regulator, biotin operon repressor / biotin---[acetyl-CoA-carboxylase] ligase
MSPIPLWVADLQKSRRGKILGRKILFLESTDSTNRRAREEARRGAPEGTAVIAESQSGGKGRLGRSWISPPGVNAYFSLVMRPPLPPERVPPMTLMAGVSCAWAIGRVTGLDVRLKWPNDIFIGGKKAAGILAEMEGGNSPRQFVILGIGINVNWEGEGMPADLRETATSLRIEAGKEFDRAGLVGETLAELEKDYVLFREGGFSERMREEWTRFALGIGKRAMLTFPGHQLFGEIRGLDRDGALLFADLEGNTRRFTAGEVSLRF